MKKVMATVLVLVYSPPTVVIQYGELVVVVIVSEQLSIFTQASPKKTNPLWVQRVRNRGQKCELYGRSLAHSWRYNHRTKSSAVFICCKIRVYPIDKVSIVTSSVMVQAKAHCSAFMRDNSKNIKIWLPRLIWLFAFLVYVRHISVCKIKTKRKMCQWSITRDHANMAGTSGAV